METLLAPLAEITAYRNAEEAIQKQQFPLQISGCIESQKCQWIYGLTGESLKWKVIIAANELRAREIAEDYRMFDREVMYYPAKDVIFFSADVHGNALSTQRLKVREALLDRKGGTIVTSIDAGMEFVLSQKIYEQAKQQVAEGETYDLETLCKNLVNMGYVRQAQVEMPGDFSVRGGILDVFPVTEDCPYRIEFWDDEIDTIRSFDVESQRSIERIAEFTIFPASELILTTEQIADGFTKMAKDAAKISTKLKKAKKFEEVNRLNDHLQEIKNDYEQYQSRIGLEAYLPYFPVETLSFFDIMPEEETIFFLDEPSRCYEKAQAVETEFRDSMESRLEKGYLLPKQPEILQGMDPLFGLLQNKQLVILSLLDGLPKQLASRAQVNVQVQPVGSYNKHFELLVDDMLRWRKNGYRVLLLCGSRTRAQRLSKDLGEYEIPAFYHEKPDMPLEAGQVMVSYGFMRHGFVYSMTKFAVVTEGDIFGTKQKRRNVKKKKYDGKAIQSFNELSVGDYVIHENHGVGIYKGIEKITVDHVSKDYIKIEYGDGGNLYVPASGLDLLQKYAGREAKQPKLNRLSSPEWKKTKTRVRKAVQEVAKEFPADKAGLNVLFVPSEAPYHERKVTLLNGPHTVLSPVAYLSGVNIVRDACQHEVIGKYIHKVMFDELMETLNLPKEELKKFAEDVLERFNNPFVDHAVTSIMLNSFPKYETRDLPGLKTYLERKGELPKGLVLGLAAIITYYKGGVRADGAEIVPNDAPEIMNLLKELWATGCTKKVTEGVLAAEFIWGEDLNKIPGLAAAVKADLDSIQEKGMLETVKGIL